jgi:hypothetical protein
MSMDTELERTAETVSDRLRARGVSMREDDSAEDVVRVLEAVEAFEGAVVAAGGDLMVDEPPPEGHAQPDDPRFRLPVRGEGEPAGLYLDRIARATEVIRAQGRAGDAAKAPAS